MSLKHANSITQAANVYLKKANTFDRFEWGGRAMKLDEGQANLGGASVTTQLNPRGGLELDNILQDMPGSADFQIVMKHTVHDRTKTQLKSCFWHVDRRTHCGDGRDRDDNNAWLEIARYHTGKATGRSIPATSWEGEEEALINVPFSSLESFDIYQTNLEESVLTAVTGAAALTSVDVCHPSACPGCDNETEAVIVAGSSLIAAGSPVLLVNTIGGDLSGWAAAISLTEWAAGGVDDLLCLGNLLIMVSTAEAETMRSDDRGTTRLQVSHADMAANAPSCIDGLDSTVIVLGAANGYVFASYDGGRTYEPISQGGATSEDINQIMIARDNPAVIYAVGVNNAIIKSTNFGETWVALTGPSAADALLEIWVADENHLLVVNDDGEIWESSDAGVTWTQQTALTGVTATLTEASISGVGGDVLYLTATDATGSIYLRNVEGGASGFWEPIAVASSTTDPINMIAAVDINKAVAVGGAGGITSVAVLIN